MTDQEFVTALETCRLPNEDFHHRDHIRLAWIYLRQQGFPEAAARLVESIRRYAAHYGAAQKFHQTITMAWLALVEDARRRAPMGASFEDLLRAFPELLNLKALDEYYSSAVLDSAAARDTFVAPDKRSLPGSIRVTV